MWSSSASGAGALTAKSRTVGVLSCDMLSFSTRSWFVDHVVAFAFFEKEGGSPLLLSS
jgi:hypothetical protein